MEKTADYTLSKTNHTLSKEWHPIKNGNLTPDDVTPGSGKKIWCYANVVTNGQPKFSIKLGKWLSPLSKEF